MPRFIFEEPSAKTAVIFFRNRSRVGVDLIIFSKRTFSMT
jgi:hypothetical protein